MIRSDMNTAKPHDYGAQEAAYLLNIHRSTLFLAVKRGILVPDYKTPQGHNRFSQGTLDAYRERIKMQAATNDVHMTAPTRILERLSRALVSAHRDHIFGDTVDLLCEAEIGIDMSCVAMWREDEGDPFGIESVAARGFPDWFFPNYERLRPNVEFATNRVLRTREPVICEDTMGSTVRQSRALWITQRAEIRSFAILPVTMEQNQTLQLLGALVVAGKKPHKYTPVELHLLKAIANLLAIAMAGRTKTACLPIAAPCIERPDVVGITRQLFALALESADEATMSQYARDLFIHETDAEAMCMLGFGKAYDIHAPRNDLLEMACLACADDGLVARQQPDEHGELFTTLAASVALRPSHRAAVAATWRGARSWSATEHHLLVSFASAYNAVQTLR